METSVGRVACAPGSNQGHICVAVVVGGKLGSRTMGKGGISDVSSGTGTYPRKEKDTKKERE